MAASTHHARVLWEGGEDVRAHRIEIADQVIAGSSAAVFGGDASRADPEGLLVASISACHMLWFLDYARREGLRVHEYEDAAEATLEGRRFTGAVLRPRVCWEGEAPSEDALAELHSRAHRACFISNSVSFPVEVALA
jgi:organic hydroperoxide reductase OsmC/OhrA